MKKLTTLFLALVVCAGILFASNTSIGGIWYNFDNEHLTAEVTYRGAYYSAYSNEYSGEVVIPSSVTFNAKTYSVTSIGGSAFNNCTGLTSITIPNSVTSIGDGAFAYCSGLTSVTIPNSVTSIGEDAFFNCYGLTSVSVEAGNTVYDSRNNCNAIIETSTNTLISGCQNTTIPNTVTSIENFAFSWCYGLTSVTIPNSVTSIGSYAFGGCTGLTSVTIQISVTSIGDHAFAGCTGLTSMTLPNSITSIGDYAFWDCTGLNSITNYATTPQSINSNVFDNVDKSTCKLYVPDESVSLYQATDVWRDFENVLPIPPSVIASGECGAEGDNLIWELLDNGTLTITGTGAMADWPSGSDVPWYDYRNDIVSILLPYGLTNIGNSAFEGCDILTSIAIPNSVIAINNRAFCGCSSLISIEIPQNVTTIKSQAFRDCNGLSSVEIPNSISNIEGGIFAGCIGLNSINVAVDNPNYCSLDGILYNKVKTMLVAYPSGRYGTYSIPNSVTNIGGAAFAYCSGLTSVSIPNSVTTIDWCAFQGCSGLSSITIPNSVADIGEYAFRECSCLTSVTIPNSVTIIRFQAFAYCTNLSTITNFAIAPQSLDNSIFSSLDKSTCKLYVPLEAVSAYQSATGWSDFQIGGAAMTAKADPDDASTFYTTFYHGSQKYKLPAGMEAYTATINGDVLELSKVAEGGDVIPAGTALILKSNAANLTMDVTDDTPVSVGENILQGVDAATPAPDNCYVLSGGSSDSSVKGIGFYRFSGTLGAHKAYLVLAPKAGAPRRLRFAFSETNTTTNVEQVPSIQVPSTKMIENGQLYIMHEGQMYDVRGNKVQ